MMKMVKTTHKINERSHRFMAKQSNRTGGSIFRTFSLFFFILLWKLQASFDTFYICIPLHTFHLTISIGLRDRNCEHGTFSTKKKTNKRSASHHYRFPANTCTDTIFFSLIINFQTDRMWTLLSVVLLVFYGDHRNRTLIPLDANLAAFMITVTYRLNAIISAPYKIVCSL